MLYSLQYSCAFSHVECTGLLFCYTFCGLAIHVVSFLLLCLNTLIFGTQLSSIWNTLLFSLFFSAILSLFCFLVHIVSLKLPILQTYFWELVSLSFLQHYSCSYRPGVQTSYNWNTSSSLFLLALSLVWQEPTVGWACYSSKSCIV